MPVISFREFRGEIPRLAADALPDGYAQAALNVDLAHGELRGRRGNAPFAATNLGDTLRAVYTEDGQRFFAWPFETYPVRSMVVDDVHHRVYYSAMLTDGPIIKMARFQREDGTYVAGSPLVGGNYQPPENSGPGVDSWVLGVPAPRARGVSDDDRLTPSLVDKSAWPGSPRLQLRVTYFLEDDAGNMVYQQSITNNEVGIDQHGVTFPQIINSNNWLDRGNKIQDMLWQFDNVPRPYKYYFYLPPDVSGTALTRTVPVVNQSAGNITITYGSTSPPDTSTPGVSTSFGNDA